MTSIGPDSKSKDPRPAGVLNREALVAIIWILSLVREERGLTKKIRLLRSAIYCASEPKIREYRKQMLSLWL